MSEKKILWTAEDLPFTGRASYFDSIPGSPHIDPRICLRIEVGAIGVELLAVLDTAAPWCILERRLAKALILDVEELTEEVAISTRLGRFTGHLGRSTVVILAEEGVDLSVDTTIFLCEDWPGGNFVGYQGFLERLRFAVDPGANRFYFGPL